MSNKSIRHGEILKPPKLVHKKQVDKHMTPLILVSKED